VYNEPNRLFNATKLRYNAITTARDKIIIYCEKQARERNLAEKKVEAPKEMTSEGVGKPICLQAQFYLRR
jgi:hypothetical protein